jgi:hypothetical protein
MRLFKSAIGRQSGIESIWQSCRSDAELMQLHSTYRKEHASPGARRKNTAACYEHDEKMLNVRMRHSAIERLFFTRPDRNRPKIGRWPKAHWTPPGA